MKKTYWYVGEINDGKSWFYSYERAKKYSDESEYTGIPKKVVIKSQEDIDLHDIFVTETYIKIRRMAQRHTS